MRSIRRVHSAAVFAAVTLIGVAACSSDLGPHIPQVARVVVRPMNDTIQLGQKLEYYAVAYDSGGMPMSNRTFTWTSSHARVATIDAANPTDSAQATGDSAGQTKIVATTGGVTSDSATLVVVATPQQGTSDTVSTVIDCNGIRRRVWGWVLHVVFSYGNSAAGQDTSKDNVAASFAVQDEGDVTVRLTRILGDPGAGNWGDDHSPAAMDGQLSELSQYTWSKPFDFLSGSVRGSGKPFADPGNGAAWVTIDTRPNACTYQFFLYGAEVVGTDESGDAMTPSPGQLYSAVFSMVPGSPADTALTFSGSGEFAAYHRDLVPGAAGTPPLSGSFLLEDPASFWMYVSGLVHDGEFGAAKVSWRLTAIERKPQP